MFEKTLGFIGGGRIVRVLLGGWQRAGFSFPAIVVSDTNADALQRLLSLPSGLPIVAGDNAAAARQDIVFVAVHPPAIAEALSAIADQLRPPAIVVSLAPKWTMERLAEPLHGFARIARMIPNAPSLVGRGFNPIAWSDALNEADRDATRRLMAPLGELLETSEETLEAYAILSAMGPTYFWPQWIELESLAPEFGLGPELARQAIRAMTLGALEMLAAPQLSPADVLDSIPVKPMADFEPELRAAYRSRLTALFEKICP